MFEGHHAAPQLGWVITLLNWLPEVACQALHCDQVDQVDQELTRQFTDEQLRRLEDWLFVIKIKVLRGKWKQALIGVFGSITGPAQKLENMRDSNNLFFWADKKTSKKPSDTTKY